MNLDYCLLLFEYRMELVLQSIIFNVTTSTYIALASHLLLFASRYSTIHLLYQGVYNMIGLFDTLSLMILHYSFLFFVSCGNGASPGLRYLVAALQARCVHVITCSQSCIYPAINRQLAVLLPQFQQSQHPTYPRMTRSDVALDPNIERVTSCSG